nr:MAG TPA: Guanine nucleotide-binding protein G(k) subunit, modulator, GPCR, inhibitory, SIGNALING [Bacteriophage sp.]
MVDVMSHNNKNSLQQFLDDPPFKDYLIMPDN